MGENTIPVSIGKPETGSASRDLARALGESAADVIRLHMAVIDREDRLESGTGEWLRSFASDSGLRRAAVSDSVLRAVHLATDAVNFTILGLLREGVGTPIEDLERASGLSRLPLAERIGDLVSAGLAVKIPEAAQVAGTGAGAALLDLVQAAAAAGERDLGRDPR